VGYARRAALLSGRGHRRVPGDPRPRRAGRAEAQGSPAEIARGRHICGATGGRGCHRAKGQPVNAGTIRKVAGT